MPSFAMRFGDILRRQRVAAQKVFSTFHRLEVSRVYAGPVSAQMIELQAFRDRPAKNLVGAAVSHHFSPINLYAPVTVSIKIELPNPAALIRYDDAILNIFPIAWDNWGGQLKSLPCGNGRTQSRGH